jgi:hypothetical protein
VKKAAGPIREFEDDLTDPISRIGQVEWFRGTSVAVGIPDHIQQPKQVISLGFIQH